MKNIAHEFQSISKTYREVGEVLTRISETDNSQDSKLVKSILQNRDCLGRIEQVNSRVVQLSDYCRKRRMEADSQQWDEISRLADDALQQAVKLNQLCSLTAKRLQSAKERLAAELAEIGKGARFLKCAKPKPNNFPKFIDSIG